MVKSYSCLLSKVMLIGLIIGTPIFSSQAEEDVAAMDAISDQLGIDPSMSSMGQGSGDSEASKDTTSEVISGNVDCNAGKKQQALTSFKRNLNKFKNSCEKLSGDRNDKRPFWDELVELSASKRSKLMRLTQSSNAALVAFRSGNINQVFNALGMNKISAPSFKVELEKIRANYFRKNDSQGYTVATQLKHSLQVDDFIKNNKLSFADARKLNNKYTNSKSSAFSSKVFGKKDPGGKDFPGMRGLFTELSNLLEQNASTIDSGEAKAAKKSLNQGKVALQGYISAMNELSTAKSCLYYKGYYLWNRDWLVRKCGADSIVGIDAGAAAETPCVSAKVTGKTLDAKSEADLKAIQAETDKSQESAKNNSLGTLPETPVKPIPLPQCSSSRADRAECEKHQKKAEAVIQPVKEFFVKNKKLISNLILNDQAIPGSLKAQCTRALDQIKEARDNCDLILPTKRETPSAETKKMYDDCYASLGNFKSDGDDYLLLKDAALFDRNARDARKTGTIRPEVSVTDPNLDEKIELEVKAPVQAAPVVPQAVPAKADTETVKPDAQPVKAGGGAIEKITIKPTRIFGERNNEDTKIKNNKTEKTVQDTTAIESEAKVCAGRGHQAKIQFGKAIEQLTDLNRPNLSLADQKRKKNLEANIKVYQNTLKTEITKANALCMKLPMDRQNSCREEVKALIDAD